MKLCYTRSTIIDVSHSLTLTHTHTLTYSHTHTLTHSLTHQITTMTTVTFREESPPLDIAENLTLTDFDSPDITSSPLTITLTGAVDEDWEGLMVEVGGTSVRVSPVEVVQQYTQQYVLNGSTSFSEYQQVGVGGAGCERSWVW